MQKTLKGALTLTTTPRDTANSRIPNWNARKASNGVRSVRGSPVMNIKSLGDIMNNPARTTNLAREICEFPAGKYQRDYRTDKANAPNDQEVIVPSASSDSTATVDSAAF